MITLSYINKLNKKLKKQFGDNVEAREENELLILSGKLSNWRDVVLAGTMSVKKNKYIGLVNDIQCREKSAPNRMPALSDVAVSGEKPDILIIGGGVIGCAIARELSRYKLDIMLIEKENDLAMQTSGRNDGIIHPGIDLKKSTQKYRYNSEGHRIFGDVCAELGVPFHRPGQYICFDNIFWKPVLYLTKPYWYLRGLKKVKVLGKQKLREHEPSIAHSISAALYFPTTGIVSPYALTIAYAENAVTNGARVFLNTAAINMEVEDGIVKGVLTNRGKIRPRIVINAAGVFCEDIAKMAGDRFYSIHPRKGTSAVLDKKYTDSIVRTALSSFGTASTKKTHTKGGGIFRSAHGNALIGPDAVETIEKEDFSTTRGSISGTFHRQEHTVPSISEEKIITYFSGTRASTYEEDFVVCKGKFTQNIVHAAGIQSPGLTSAPAIGKAVAKMAVELLGGEQVVGANESFDPNHDEVPNLQAISIQERAELIARNPDYGVIICRCEEISKGEILDALRRNIPCDTIDGVKRRVRPGMGRCQGSFCGPLVLDLIAREKHMLHTEIKKSGDGSNVLFDSLKQPREAGASYAK